MRAIERIHGHVNGVLRTTSGRSAAARGSTPTTGSALLGTCDAGRQRVADLRTVRRAPAAARAGGAVYRVDDLRPPVRIPADRIPPTLPDFRAYMRDMLRGPTLAVGPASRAIAAALLDQPLPPGLRQLAGSTRLFTVGLLPPSIRRRYGTPGARRATAPCAC